MRGRDSNRFIALMGTVAGLLASSSAFATTQIGLNPLVIQAAPNQTINILGAATESGISGLDIYVQIGNGGVNNGNATNPAVPKITNIDLTTGVFSGNNTGNSGRTYSSNGLLAYDGITSSTGLDTVSVPGNSVLGTLTLDASSLAGTTFDVYFYNVGINDPAGPFFGDGTIADSAQSLYDTNGGASVLPFSGSYLNTGAPTAYGSAPLEVSIVAVPEPATFSGLILFGSGLLLRRSTRNRT